MKLDRNTLQLLVFTNTAFANNKDFSSQIRALLVAANANNDANILYWVFVKCKRVTRSVLASELLGMVYRFDMAHLIKTTLNLILNKDIPLVVYINSKSLYNCLVKLGTTQEKRLIIDVMCIREAYKRREIAQVKWINSKSNLTNSITKSKPTNALKNLINTNKIDLQVQE